MAEIATEIGNLVATVGGKAVYGEEREIDGETIIPVAISWYGFGAGQSDSEGSGGGGGGFSAPVGAYVRSESGVSFEPNLIALLAVGVPLVAVLGKAISRIIRVLKK